MDTITLVERLQQQLEVAKTHLQGGGSPVRIENGDFFSFLHHVLTLRFFFFKKDNLYWRIFTESIQRSHVFRTSRLLMSRKLLYMYTLVVNPRDPHGSSGGVSFCMIQLLIFEICSLLLLLMADFFTLALAVDALH